MELKRIFHKTLKDLQLILRSLSLDDPLNAFYVASGENWWPLWFHEGPHSLVCREIWILKLKNEFWFAILYWKFEFTLKKAAVEPPFKAPYLILVCFAKSSALSIGESIRSTVKNAAKFAVYDEIWNLIQIVKFFSQ